MKYAIDLIDAIALADGTRTLRDVLLATKLPDDAFVFLVSDLREVLSEFLAREDIEPVINELMRLTKEKK